MPNSIVQLHRQRIPTETRSDDELTLLYARKFPKKLESTPDFKTDFDRIQTDKQKALRPNLSGELGSSFRSGVDQAQGKLWDTLALVGDAVGSKTLSRIGEEGRKRNEAEAAENAPSIPNMEGIENFSDAVRFGVGLIGSQAPQIGGTIGAATFGALLAPAVGATATVGGLAAGAAAGFTQMQNRGTLVDQGAEQSKIIPTAVGVGILGGILETLVPLKVTSRLLKGTTDKVAGAYIARALKNIPVNAVAEGGTEVGQEIVSMAGELYANDHNPEFKISADQVKSRLANAGVAGVLLGGVTGPIEAISGRKEPESEDKGKDAPTEKKPESKPEDFIRTKYYPDVKDDRLEEIRTFSLRLKEIREKDEKLTPEDQAFLRSLNEQESTALTFLTTQNKKAETASPDVDPPRSQPDIDREAEIHERFNQFREQEQREAVEADKTRQFVEGVESGTAPPPSDQGNPAFDQFREKERQDATALENTRQFVNGIQQETAPQSSDQSSDQGNPTFDQFREQERQDAAALENTRQFVDGIQQETVQEEVAPALEQEEQVEKEIETPTPVSVEEKPLEKIPEPEDVEVSEEGLEEGSLLVEAFLDIDNDAGKNAKTTSKIIPFNTKIFEGDYSESNVGLDLASDARGKEKDQNSDKSLTRRGIFVRDNETGKILLLGAKRTPDNKKKGTVGKASVKPPKEVFGERTKVISMFGKDGLFKIKTESGKQRFTPLALTRLRTASKGFQQEFTQAQYQAIRDKAKGKTEKLAEAEDAAEAIRASQGDVEFSREEDEELTDVVIDLLPKTGANLVQGGMSRTDIRAALLAFMQDDSNAQDISPLLLRFLDEVSFGNKDFREASLIDKQTTIFKVLSGHIHEWYKQSADGGTEFRQAILEGIGRGFRRDIPPSSLPENREDLAIEAKFRKPGESSTGFQRETSGRITAIFKNVLSALAAAGVDVKIFKTGNPLNEIEGNGMLEKEFGAFNKDRNMVVLAMHDIINPSAENLRTLIHEAGHVLFSDMSPDIQGIIKDAINDLSNAELGITHSPDPRIIDRDNTEIPADQLMEEKLVESLALNMAPDVARNVGARIVRLAKSILLRSAIWIQHKFNGGASPQLAMEYTKNRFRQFLANDHLSYLDWIGGVAISPAREVNFYQPVEGEGWFDTWYDHSTNSVQFADAVPYDVDSAIWNIRNTMFRKTRDLGDKPSVVKSQADASRIENERYIAGHNEVRNLVDQLWNRFNSSGQNINNLAKADFLKQVLKPGIDSESVIEGIVMEFNRLNIPAPRTDVEISNLNSDSFKHSAVRNAIRFIKKMKGRMQRQGERSVTASEKVSKQLTKKASEMADAEKNFQNAAHIESVAMDSLRAMIKKVSQYFKDGLALGTARGKLAAAVMEITGQKDGILPARFEAVLNKTASSILSERIRFVDTLRAVSRLDIDFDKAKIADIQKAILEAAVENPLLAPLSDTNPNGKLTEESVAMLAIVVSFARSNQHAMDMLTLRESNNNDAVKVIKAMIELAKREQNEDLKEARKMAAKVPRLSRLAGRILERYAKVRADNRRLIKARNRLDQVAQNSKDSMGLINSKLSELEAILGAEDKPFEAMDGQEYHVPKSPKDSRDKVRESKKRFVLTANNSKPKAEMFSDLEKMQAWLAANDKDRDSLWNSIEREIRVLKKNLGNKAHVTIKRSAMAQFVASLGERMAETGTAAGRQIRQMSVTFNAFIQSNANKADENGVRWGVAEKKAMDALGVKDSETFLDFYYHPVLHFINSRKTLQESNAPVDLVMAEVRNYLEKRDGVMTNDEWKALEKFYKETGRNSAWRDNMRKSSGIKIKDRFIGMFRESIGHPLFNVARGVKESMGKTHETMKDLGWNGTKFETTKKELLKQMETDKGFQDKIRALFTDPVIREFLEPLINKSDPAFSAPILESDFRPDADPVFIKAAWNSAGGDIFKFIESMYLLHGGQTSSRDYTVETLGTLFNYFNLLDKLERKKKKSQKKGAPSVAHQLIDGRISESFPEEWLQFSTFDETSNRIAMSNIAFHANFGRDGDAMISAFATAENEIKSLQGDFTRFRTEVLRSKANRNKTEDQILKLVKEAAIKEGGKDLWNKIKNSEKIISDIKTGHRQFGAWHTSQGSGFVDLRASMEVIQTISALAVQGIRTTMLNTLSMFDAVTRFGVSRTTLSQVKRNWTSFAGEAFGTLGQMFNKQIQMNAENVNRRVAIGQYDTATQTTLRQRVSALMQQDINGNRVERGLIKGSRIVREVIQAGVGQGDDQRFANFKPLSPFTTTTLWMSSATIDGVWHTFGDMVQRATDFVNNPANAATIKDPDFRFKASDLGYKSGIILDDATTFKKLNTALQDYGMDLESLARDASVRQAGDPKAPVFTDEQFRNIASLAQNEITLESNFTNTSISLFTNPVLRLGAPLLKWSIGRTHMLRRAFQNEDRSTVKRDGTKDWAAFKAGMKMFTAILPLGLAYAWIMDEYDEEIRGKKSDIRGFGQDNNFLAMVEQTARVGTFGLWGDLGNTVGNFTSEGGDLRGISFDNRVLFMNTTLNFINAMGTWLKQGDATYATVYRPLLQSLGGSGYLQNIQIINNLFSPDLPGFEDEARVTARINANNYLRTMGRELEMDVRTGSGYRAIPNPIKPHVSDMYLASLANDPGDFDRSMRSAIAAAEREGKPDPVDHVVRSFQTKHPLRTVFKTPPSKAEFNLLLSRLSSKGRRDVLEAVNLFNGYAEPLGIKPFDGDDRTRKKPKKAAFSLKRKRQKLGGSALSSLRSGSVFSLR